MQTVATSSAFVCVSGCIDVCMCIMYACVGGVQGKDFIQFN